jgi:hypothetical protein
MYVKKVVQPTEMMSLRDSVSEQTAMASVCWQNGVSTLRSYRRYEKMLSEAREDVAGGT